MSDFPVSRGTDIMDFLGVCKIWKISALLSMSGDAHIGGRNMYTYGFLTTAMQQSRMGIRQLYYLPISDLYPN